MEWWKQDATPEELRAAVLAVVRNIPPPGLPTTDVMRRMGCTRAHMDGLARALKAVRTAEPKFAREMPGEGRFGNPLILWHDPDIEGKKK